MTREMDAKIAEWMGWTEVRYMMLYAHDVGWVGIDTEGKQSIVPSFSTSLDAMSKAEDVVRERGLGEEYGRELASVVKPTWGRTGVSIHATATATADQRARALCRVIDQETQGD